MKLNKLGGFGSLVAYASILALFAGNVNAMDMANKRARKGFAMKGATVSEVKNPVPLARNANKIITEPKPTSQEVADGQVKEEQITPSKRTKVRKVKTPLEEVVTEQKPTVGGFQKNAYSSIFNPIDSSERTPVVLESQKIQELEAIESQVSALAERKAFYKTKAEEYKARAEELEKEVGALNEEVAALNDKNAESQEKIQELEAIESKVSTLAERKTFYKTKAEGLEKEVGTLNDKNRELESKKSILKKEIESLKKEIAELKVKNEELQEIEQQFSKLNDSCHRLIQNLEKRMTEHGMEQSALDNSGSANTGDQIELLNGLIESVFATIDANKRIEETTQKINDVLDQLSDASKDDNSEEDVRPNEQIEVPAVNPTSNAEEEEEADELANKNVKILKIDPIAEEEEEISELTNKNVKVLENPIDEKTRALNDFLNEQLSDVFGEEEEEEDMTFDKKRKVTSDLLENSGIPTGIPTMMGSKNVEPSVNQKTEANE